MNKRLLDHVDLESGIESGIESSIIEWKEQWTQMCFCSLFARIWIDDYQVALVDGSKILAVVRRVPINHRQKMDMFSGEFRKYVVTGFFSNVVDEVHDVQNIRQHLCDLVECLKWTTNRNRHLEDLIVASLMEDWRDKGNKNRIELRDELRELSFNDLAKKYMKEIKNKKILHHDLMLAGGMMEGSGVYFIQRDMKEKTVEHQSAPSLGLEYLGLKYKLAKLNVSFV